MDSMSANVEQQQIGINNKAGNPGFPNERAFIRIPNKASGLHEDRL